MAKVCPECGREYENRATMCRICGRELDEVPTRNQAKGTATNHTRPQTARQKPVVVNIQEEEDEPYLVVEPQAGPSGLSITALVFSLLGCLSVVGLVLGIVDLCINKHRKKVCSVLAIVFCGFWTIGILAWAVASNDTKAPALASTGDAGQTVGYDSGNGTATKDTFGLMETAEMNNVQITMTNYKESYGSDWNSPEDGNVFVLVEFDIANNSNSDLAVSSVMSFDAYVDGYSTSLSFGALVENDESQLDGTVAAGKRMRGWIGYEVPSNWRNLEIHFAADVWSGNKFKFSLDNSGETANNQGSNQGNNESPESASRSTDTSARPQNSDLRVDIVGEYTLPDGIGWYTRHFMIIRNNSAETIDVSTSSLAYASDGTMLSAANSSFDALGAGCTSVLYEAFETDAAISYYDTDMECNSSRYYESVIQDLSYVQNNIDGGAVFQVTNNGSDPADFVEGYALFFKNGVLVSYESAYFVDDDSELKPGATISKQLTSYEDFDTIQFYLNGRK